MIELSVAARINIVNRRPRSVIPQTDRSTLSFKPSDFVVAKGLPHQPLYLMQIPLMMGVHADVLREPAGFELVETGADVRFSPSAQPVSQWESFKGNEVISYENLSLEQSEWLGDRTIYRHRSVVGKGTVEAVPSCSFAIYFIGDYTFEYADAVIRVEGDDLIIHSSDSGTSRTPLLSRSGPRGIHIIIKSIGRMMVTVGDATERLNFDLEGGTTATVDGATMALDMWFRDEYEAHMPQILDALESGS